MVKFDENFCDNKAWIKKDRKARLDPNLPESTLLENQLWLFLYNLGFRKLNCGGECLISWGKNGEYSKRVDITAENEEALIIAECSTQQDYKKKMGEWANTVVEFRKNIKLERKNITYVYFTNFQPDDKTMLAQKGIILLTLKELEYFQEIAKSFKTVKSFAMNRFLAQLSHGETIRALNPEDYTIPAIKCKYSSKEHCYLFGIQPAKLLPIANVLHRKLDVGANDATHYQRLLKKKKVTAIRKYIETERGVFPTNIIASFEPKKDNVFEPVGAAISGIQFGKLSLPRQYNAVSIIDGQHRLFSYTGLKQAKTDLIYVIAFCRMEIEKQIKTFITINDTQTKVSPSLLWDLYPAVLAEDMPQARIAVLVKKLNTEPSSALFGSIKYDSAAVKVGATANITLEALCTGVEGEKLIVDKESIVSRLEIEDKTDEILFLLLRHYFDTIKELYPEHWARKKKVETLLKSNQGIGALTKLFSIVVGYIAATDKDSISTAKRNPAAIKEWYSKLLRPVIEKIKVLEKEGHIKDFKEKGESGKTKIFQKFVLEINKDNNTFGCDIIKTMQNPEITRIIETLKSGAEDDRLEAKAAFFTNTRIMPHIENMDGSLTKILKGVVAFANYKGGELVFGLKDETWEPEGLDGTDLKKHSVGEFRRKLKDQLRAKILKLPVLPEIEMLHHLGRTFCRIRVKPLPKERFVQRDLALLKEDGEPRPYVRRDGNSELLGLPELSAYCAQMALELPDL